MRVLLVFIVLTYSACSKIDRDEIDIQREEDYHRKDFSEDGQKLDH
jgi:hypothetical protein